MSTLARVVINAIPEIKNKRYLELGILRRETFDAVLAQDKTSVDLAGQSSPTYLMTTDQFFCTISPAEKWDVIFIDANHDLPYVWRDWNNSVLHLNPGGLILVHDLYPDTEEHTAPGWCSDGYRFYLASIEAQNRHKMIEGDYGLTVYFEPKTFALNDRWMNLSYRDFIRIMGKNILYPLDNVIAHLSTL